MNAFQILFVVSLVDWPYTADVLVELGRDTIRSRGKDTMRKDVVVTDTGDDDHVWSERFRHPSGDHPIQQEDLFWCSRDFAVNVVSARGSVLGGATEDIADLALSPVPAWSAIII
jgi:hypothetical protein